MSVGEFIDQAWNSPHAAIGRIKGGANIIQKDSALLGPALGKTAFIGIGSFLLLRSTLLTIPLTVLTGAYCCWENGSWTPESANGKFEQTKKTIEEVGKKIEDTLSNPQKIENEVRLIANKANSWVTAFDNWTKTPW